QHRLGRLEEAERSYDRVLEQAWALGDQGRLEFAFCNRAEVRWLRGQPRPALEDLERAVAGLERARATIRGKARDARAAGRSPAAETRATFLGRQVAAFDRLVRFRADTAQPVAAFEAAERFHGRSLSELLDPALELAPRAPSAAEVRAGLQPGEVLIAYWLGEDRVLAWAVDRERVRQAQAPVAPDELVATLSAYLRPLRSAVAAEDSALTPAADREQAAAEHLELGRRLHRWLVDPLPRWAREAERWIVVPDGPLHYLPFAALPEACGPGSDEEKASGTGAVRPGTAEPGNGQPGNGEPGGGLHHGAYAHCRFLGFEKALSRAPSAGVVLALRRRDARRDPPAGSLLAMAPDLPPEVSGPSGVPGPPIPEATVNLETVLRSRGRLEHHRSEAKSIAEQTPGARSVLGEEATEARWKAEAPGYRWLHLASHGLMDDDDPLGSGILLAPGAGEDGLLRLPEVLELELASRLVTLSACRSGRGRLQRGEGIQGLGQAFLAAGASALVLSLWDVDDRSTPRLMEAFYDHLRAGTGPAEALRRARRSLAASHDERELVFRRHRVSLAHPRFWAGFVVLGEG
ncbi:MAG: CHAT domain-containing protein, partial [Holophagales bacterium]|nr:CHAT domain-containing protein [Holophagales bacterium]